MVVTIDSFEDQDTAEYGNGSTTHSIVSDSTIDGNYAIEFGDSSDEGWLWSDSGLPTYPQEGDTWRFTSYAPETFGAQHSVRVGFGIQDANNLYYVDCNADSNLIRLVKLDGGVETELASSSIDWPYGDDPDPTVDIEVEWLFGGDFTVTASYGGSTQATLTAHDETYTDGGFGFSNYTFEARGRFDAFERDDRSAPPQPGGVTATANNDDSTVSWDDVSNEAGYRVYRNQTGNVTTSDTLVADVGGGTTSYTDTGLEDGEQYHYAVTSYNDFGESSPSATASATMSVPAPTLDRLYQDGEDVVIEYTLADDSPDGTVEILRSTDGSAGTSVASVSDLSQTSATDTPPTQDVYYYTVRRSTDHATADSNQQSLSYRQAPTAPELVVDGTDVRLTWSLTDNESGGDVSILRGTDPDTLSSIATVQPSTTEYVDTGRTPGETYFYAIERTVNGVTATSQQSSTDVPLDPTPVVEDLEDAVGIETPLAVEPDSDFEQLLRSIATVIRRHEYEAQQVEDAHHVGTAANESLERLGQPFDVSRRDGESDDHLRARIIIAGFASHSSGTRDELLRFVKELLGTSYDDIVDTTDLSSNPATWQIEVSSSVLADFSLTTSELATELEKCVPASHTVSVSSV